MDTSGLLQRGTGRDHQVGAPLSHGSPCWLCRDRRAGDTARALQPLPRDGEIPAVNYLASMFINQQFLCKQTHPEPLLPVTLATAQSRPRLGMCSGLPPGPQPCLQLFAGSLFLPQGGFRSLDFLSIGSWASPSLNPGPPYCGIIDPPVIVSWTFGLLDPGSIHH